MKLLGRGRIGTGRAAAGAAALLAALAAVPASADPPPAAAGTTSHGFAFDRGRLTAIDHPDAATVPATPDGQTGTGALGVNDRGQILGVYEGRDRIVRRLRINDRGQVVGIYADAGGAVHGFLADDGQFATIDVPGATATAVLGINNRGQTVGSYVDAGGAYHGFVRDRDGEVTTLSEAPGAEPTMGGTQPAMINDRGQIVGVAYDAKGGSRGFLLDRGRFTLLDGTSGATYTRALDIDNHGRIVGDYGTKPPVSDGNGSARRVDLGRGLQSGARGAGTWLP